ncbi:PaaI family thioesterase [Pseudooceanicola sp. HF7]|uniref:PaaI family thioesterase n=1 Tax=Pseudooceanicola sp. HF7 TaxID=2721560 RepID=UPI001431D419|nr:PaaI family thioesterase [Pseudooceanicola sp. HF7]NIZ07892.1 PaaI family thioesterase [Pseudooceanicola sp. HF7]
MNLTELARQFSESLPHARALGIRAVTGTPGTVTFALPYDERFIGDPATGILAGGVISTLLDTSCGASVLSHPLCGGTTATLDLRIDYMRAATPGQGLRAEAECYHVTRSVAFVRARAWDEDGDSPVATAAGAFTFQMVEEGQLNIAGQRRPYSDAGQV